MKREFDNSIGDMTDTIEIAVRKQEQLYIAGFTMFLRRKEAELRDVLTKMEEKHKMSDSKDEIISQLRTLIQRLEADFDKFFKKQNAMKLNNRKVMEMVDDLKHDTQMLKDKAMQKMRENKQTERILFDERLKKEEVMKDLQVKVEENK